MRAAWVALLAVLAASGPAPAHAAGTDATLNHIIYCNGSPVGSSVLRFQRQGDELVVETDISAKVSAGPLTLFTYRHTGREVWRGDTLVALDTKTDDNGSRMAVTGRAEADGFHVQGIDGAAVVDPGVRPTSYWREDSMQQGRLLDTENGRVLRVKATLLAKDAANDARQYRLSGQIKHDLQLNYAGHRLIVARFQKLGAEIEFRAADLPAPQVAVAPPEAPPSR
jgi:hypothetical protein